MNKILQGNLNLCLHRHILDENLLCLHNIQRIYAMVNMLSKTRYFEICKSSKTVSLGF